MKTSKSDKLSLFVTMIITSVFWVMLLLYRINTTQNTSVKVVGELFDTINRQKSGWENTYKANSLLASSLSGECGVGSSCYMQVYTEVTKLQTLSQKEKLEIQNLWKSNLQSKEFNSYFDQLSSENKTAILNLIKTTFQEDKKESSALL